MSALPWTTDRLVPDERRAHGLSFSPAAAVFNNRIYVVHQGRGNDGRLWYTTFDGAHWTADTPLPAAGARGIKGSPTVAVYNNHLYIAYRGQDDRLCLAWLNAQGLFGVDSPGFGLSYSPAMVVYRDRLFIVYQGRDDDAGKLLWTTTNASTWDTPQTIGSIRVTGSPAVTVYQNKVHCFHKGTNESLDLNNILLFDNLCERMGVTDPWVRMVMDCMLGVAESVTPVGDVKLVAQTGTLLAEGIRKITARQSDWTWHVTYDGSWSADVLCPSASAAYGVGSESPAAVVYANSLFNLRQGRDGSILWCGLYNGDAWMTDQEVRTSGGTALTTGAPALVVFNDVLYAFHGGHNDSGWMWMTSLRIPRPVGPERRVSFQSALGTYVAAELASPTLELTATRSAVGGWETFTLLNFGEGRVALRADNGRFVCAELGQPGCPLTASREAVGDWELFTLHPGANGKVLLRAANGLPVAVSFGAFNMRLAAAPGVGPGFHEFTMRDV